MEEEKSLWFVKKFKENYEELKEKQKIEFTYEELNKELFLTNLIRQQKVLPDRICYYILGVLLDTTYKYSDLYMFLINPNPGSVLSLKEASFFNEKEKKEFEKNLNELIALSRKILKERLNVIDNENCNLNEIIKESFKLFKKNREKLKEIYDISSKKWLEKEELEKNDYAF